MRPPPARRTAKIRVVVGDMRESRRRCRRRWPDRASRGGRRFQMWITGFSRGIKTGGVRHGRCRKAVQRGEEGLQLRPAVEHLVARRSAVRSGSRRMPAFPTCPGQATALEPIERRVGRGDGIQGAAGAASHHLAISYPWRSRLSSARSGLALTLRSSGRDICRSIGVVIHMSIELESRL